MSVKKISIYKATLHRKRREKKYRVSCTHDNLSS